MPKENRSIPEKMSNCSRGERTLQPKTPTEALQNPKVSGLPSLAFLQLSLVRHLKIRLRKSQKVGVNQREQTQRLLENLQQENETLKELVERHRSEKLADPTFDKRMRKGWRRVEEED